MPRHTTQYLAHILWYKFGPEIRPNFYTINLGDLRFGPKIDLATLGMTSPEIVFCRVILLCANATDQIFVTRALNNTYDCTVARFQ